VSTGYNPQAGAGLSEQTIEQIRRQINRLFEEVAALSEQDLPPSSFYAEFLQRALAGIAAPAGAVWLRTPQGNLQMQFQINMREVGLDSDESARQSHGELLRQTCLSGRAQIVPPRSGTGSAENGLPAPGNPTDFVVLLAPILIEKQIAGLVEVWQDRRHNPDAMPGFLQFLVRMASLASVYTRNTQLRTMTGQQQVWTQLEAFTRQIHNSLNPTEVSYIVANEGRRLIECDRVSVATRLGQKVVVEAISGADVVEKRSNLVQLMRKLVEEVTKWGERLVFNGTKDDTLPPGVMDALDDYLAESTSKILVVLPLEDEREKDNKKPARSTIIMESFDPPTNPEQMIARLDVVARHSAGALYNAIEHKRIPMRWIWMPLAKVQEGLGGKTRAIIYASSAAAFILLLMMIFVPYPLKMDAKGQLLPEERRWVFSPVEAQVVEFARGLESGTEVRDDQDLVKMHDVKLQMKLLELQSDIDGAANDIRALSLQYSAAATEAERLKISSEMEQKRVTVRRKRAEQDAMKSRTHSIEGAPGYFFLKSPINGTILSSDFREQLTNRYVKPSEQLIRIGDKDLRWEVELKIPQKHIGQVLRAFKDPNQELDVDLLLSSNPTKTYRGKLARHKIAGEANPDRTEQNESEPVVLAFVRVSPINGDIPEDMVIPRRDLVAGTEVHSKVRCGNRSMGYSLFYGVWEFFYEKVVFFF